MKRHRLREDALIPQLTPGSTWRGMLRATHLGQLTRGCGLDEARDVRMQVPNPTQSQAPARKRTAERRRHCVAVGPLGHVGLSRGTAERRPWHVPAPFCLLLPPALPDAADKLRRRPSRDRSPTRYWVGTEGPIASARQHILDFTRGDFLEDDPYRPCRGRPDRARIGESSRGCRLRREAEFLAFRVGARRRRLAGDRRGRISRGAAARARPRNDAIINM